MSKLHKLDGNESGKGKVRAKTLRRRKSEIQNTEIKIQKYSTQKNFVKTRLDGIESGKGKVRAKNPSPRKSFHAPRVKYSTLK